MGMPPMPSTQEWRASQDDRPQSATAGLSPAWSPAISKAGTTATAGEPAVARSDKTGCHTRLPIHWQREHLAYLRTAMPYRKRRKIAAIKTSNDAQSRQHCLWTMRGPTRDVAYRRIQESRIQRATIPAPPLRSPAQDETSSWHR